MTAAERELTRQAVVESRRAQGLPDHVEDPAVLALAVRFLEDPTPTEHQHDLNEEREGSRAS